MKKFTFTIQGISWSVHYGWTLFSWPVLLAVATTLGASTVFKDNGNCPDAQSCAHEFYHVLHTSWTRYFFPYTVGRIWGSTYWHDEEAAADQYEIAHKNDLDFVNAAATIMAALPPGTRYETINHTL